jgi:hypothetical protein
MKNMVFWFVTRYDSDAAERFGGSHHLHLQGRIVSEARDKQRQAENRATCRYNPEDRNFSFVEWNNVTVRATQDFGVPALCPLGTEREAAEPISLEQIIHSYICHLKLLHVTSCLIFKQANEMFPLFLI